MTIYEEIKTKPIIIIGQGPSVQRLRENIEMFRGHDVLWGSLNRFHVAEEEILSTINAHIDVLWFSALLRYEEMHEHIKSAGKRGSLIMTKAAVAEYFDFPANIYSSDFGTGFSSLFAMLCALIKLGAQNIYLIGFDGQAMNKEDVYYGQHKMNSDDYKSRMRSIARDTKMMNIFFWEYVGYALNVSHCSISINNLAGSSLNCFPLLEIDRMASLAGKGVHVPPLEKKAYLKKKKYSNKSQMVRVIAERSFISAQYGNVDVGQILHITPNQTQIFVSNGLVKILPSMAPPPPVTVVAPVERIIHERKRRKTVKRKTVDSYYTMEHPELLTRLSKIFK